MATEELIIDQNKLNSGVVWQQWRLSFKLQTQEQQAQKFEDTDGRSVKPPVKIFTKI